EAKTFEAVVSDYEKLSEKIAQIKEEIESLDTRRKGLDRDQKALSSEIERLKKEKGNLEEDNRDLKVRVANYRQIRTEMEQLLGQKTRLESEMAGMEAEMRRLQQLGFSETDLLKLGKLIDATAKKVALDAGVLKDRLLTVAVLFGDMIQLEDWIKEENEKRKALGAEVSTLRGEVEALERQKAVLQGEIAEALARGSSTIEEAVGHAAAQMHQAGIELKAAVKSSNSDLDKLCTDILNTGVAVGQMMGMVAKGEESRKDLEAFLQDMKKRFGAT
ncbi:MAG: hypothetical protein Q7T04_07620, partial [Dehalococcoidia bacterium]|nr:hypothetical protein [Dehalococcoidia bacterium]